MFWKSVIGGLAIFGRPQVWVAVVFYIMVNFIFMVIVTTIAGRGKSGSRMAAGCVSGAIGGIVFHGMIISLLVTFLFPILLGDSSATPISGIIASLGTMIKLGIFVIVVVMVLSFIPVIGNFIDHVPGIEVFLESLIIFRLFCEVSLEQVLGDTYIQGSVYPGIWSVLGFLIIAGIITGLLKLSLGLLSIFFEDEPIRDLVVIILGPAVAVLGGLTPLFMYSSYTK
jgi:hypothetical protein